MRGSRDGNGSGSGSGASSIGVTGTVSRIYFGSNEFTAGEMRDADSGRFVKFAGKCFAKLGDRVTIRGRWITHPKFGRQIEVESFEFNLELDREGLQTWLAKSEAAAGIGPSRAKAIVDKYGDSFDAAMTGDPQEVARACGVPVDVIRNLQNEWLSREAINRAMVELAKWGVTPGRAAKLVEAHGPGVVGIVSNDPYWLIGRVSRFGFSTVDQIALKVGISRTHPSRIRHCLLWILENAADGDGHTWIPWQDLMVEAVNKLAIDGQEDGGASIIGDAIYGSMVPDGTLTVLDQGVRGVFIDSLLETEKFVTGRLRAMGGTKFIESVTAEQVVSQNAALNEDQVRAVVSAFGWRASVISGGAGVGKTFSVNTIASLADGANLTVALCAPTGKAAQRLSEMTGRAATTIHRLLEPQRVKEDKGELKFKFGRDESCPLESDIVIVDEVSMVDVRLMKSLLLAIDPNRTTLILVGDHNQLPSVGPAAILRDAIASGICHVTILHKVVRQAGELKLNVSATLDGQVMPTSADALETARSAMVGDSPKIAPWYVFKKDSPQDVRTILHSLFAEKLRTYSIERNGSLDKIDPAWDVQLLTPMHAGPIGTKSLNAMLQRIFQREAGVDVEPWNGEGEPRPLPGDKVIYLRNDQEIGIMNGTMGRVLQRDKGSLIVLWDCVSEPVEIDSERVGNVRLAYAMTVHKSQGSEFPVVVFVCAKPHTIMHHRGLFYTAVSRARQSSIVIGDPWAIANCARTVTLDKRRTLSTYEATTRDVDSEDCGGILSATG